MVSECVRLGKKYYEHFVQKIGIWYRSLVKLVVHSMIEVEIDAKSKEVEVVDSDLHTVESPAISVVLDGTSLATFVAFQVPTMQLARDIGVLTLNKLKICKTHLLPWLIYSVRNLN